jgi:hypothetical protein
MAGPREGMGTFGWLVTLCVVAFPVVMAGSVYVPPYFANRSVALELGATVKGMQPVDSDDAILSDLNRRMREHKVTRFFVENGTQQSDLDFQLKREQLTISRNGNISFSLEAHYTQDLFIPVLKKEVQQPFVARSP